MFNLDNITDKNDNNWPYRSLVIGPSGSGKRNFLINLIQQNKTIMSLIKYIYIQKI